MSSAADIKRDAILMGNRDADKLHRKLNLRDEVTNGLGFVDIYEVIETLDIPFLFRKLHGLLGYCMTQPYVGIMINEGRPPMMQRFTAAHELGHITLGHEGSFDRHVFEVVDDSAKDRPPEEIAADSFANAFLFPKWLFNHHFEKLGWDDRGYLLDPNNIYQLSLRVAGSYQATTWSLFSHKLITFHQSKAIASESRQKIIKRLLGDRIRRMPYSDAWHLNLKDNGNIFPVKQYDHVVLDLESLPTSGYTWNLDNGDESEIQVISSSQVGVSDLVGSGSINRIILRINGTGNFKLSLGEKRPWQLSSEPRRTFETSFGIMKLETKGLTNYKRKKLIAG